MPARCLQNWVPVFPASALTLGIAHIGAVIALGCEMPEPVVQGEQ
jgi:hypothetical protein